MNKKQEIENWFNNKDNWEQLLINTKNVTTTEFNRWGLDLLTHMVQSFLEKDIDYQYKILKDNKIEHWITQGMSLQIRSNSSPFYYKYRKQLCNERELLDINYEIEHNDYDEESELHEKLINCIESEIDKLNPYEKELITQKIKYSETYHSLYKKWKISKSHLEKDLKIIQYNIRCNCAEKLNIKI